MAAESKATTIWEGDLAHGRGTTSASSGAVPDVEVTWQARTERTPGTTSPEELLAAAHSSCYCMALSHQFAEDGNPPALGPAAAHRRCRHSSGRPVWMEWRTWQHVVDEHAELEGLLHEVMRTVAAPEHREPDPRPGRERYFRRAGLRGWIRVVTEFAGSADRVITAFPQENDPRREGLDR